MFGKVFVVQQQVEAKRRMAGRDQVMVHVSNQSIFGSRSDVATNARFGPSKDRFGIDHARCGIESRVGFAVSGARLALPDTGLISYAELLDQARDIRAAITIPLLGVCLQSFSIYGCRLTSNQAGFSSYRII